MSLETQIQTDTDVCLEELLKTYSENHPTVNEHVSEVEEVVLSVENSFEYEAVPLINIGDEYQAQIDSSRDSFDVQEVPVDELLWSPPSLDDYDDKSIDEYLRILHTEYPLSDNEIFLQTLLNYQFDIESALNHFRQLSQKTIYPYSAWSLPEIEDFEQGLREYGKNFYKISLFRCPNRSVREVVHYYYQWKKTDRHAIFLAQQRFRPFSSVSHLIEKLIEEQESICKKHSFDQVDNTTISANKSSMEIRTATVA